MYLLNLISVFNVFSICQITCPFSAYCISDTMPQGLGLSEGHNPCLHLRVDSRLVGSSEEVATG